MLSSFLIRGLFSGGVWVVKEWVVKENRRVERWVLPTIFNWDSFQLLIEMEVLKKMIYPPNRTLEEIGDGCWMIWGRWMVQVGECFWEARKLSY